MKMKAIIIGCGARGGETYGRYFHETGEAEIVAICDNNPAKLESCRKEFGLAPEQCYADYNQLLAQGKIADFAVVAVMDRDHYDVAMKAMALGYHLLLEKPVSESPAECIAIRDYAEAHNLIVTVCHVMRYTSYYRYLKKLIADGRIGTLMGIEQTEDVAFWHMAHAFVRGNFCNSNTTSPMILQKCCHDMDLLVYLTEQRPLYVSSMGSLRYFKSENAPEGSANRCVDCKVANCPFNAVDFYEGNIKELIRQGRPTNVWPYAQVAVDPTPERIMDSLRTTKWGKCVFRSDNNVVDHQFSTIQFANGLVGTLTMIGFSADGGRQTHVYGTEGEIFLNEQTRTITLHRFNEQKQVTSFDDLATDFSGHGGGDKIMLHEFFDSLTSGVKTINSDIVRSIYSHLMCFCAEKSRLEGGKPVHIDEILQTYGNK